MNIDDFPINTSIYKGFSSSFTYIFDILYMSTCRQSCLQGQHKDGLWGCAGALAGENMGCYVYVYILYYIILYCIILYYIILYHIISYHIILYYIILYYIIYCDIL